MYCSVIAHLVSKSKSVLTGLRIELTIIPPNLQTSVFFVFFSYKRFSSKFPKVYSDWQTGQKVKHPKYNKSPNVNNNSLGPEIETETRYVILDSFAIAKQLVSMFYWCYFVCSIWIMNIFNWKWFNLNWLILLQGFEWNWRWRINFRAFTAYWHCWLWFVGNGCSWGNLKRK